MTNANNLVWFVAMILSHCFVLLYIGIDFAYRTAPGLRVLVCKRAYGSLRSGFPASRFDRVDRSK